MSRIYLSMAAVRKAAAERPDGAAWLERTLAAGRLDRQWLILEGHERMRQFSPAPEAGELIPGFKPAEASRGPRTVAAAAAPVARERWPGWAKALALMATADDKGLGDVVARLIGPIGSEAFKTWHRRIFGKDCRCSERQNYWNQAYPLH